MLNPLTLQSGLEYWFDVVEQPNWTIEKQVKAFGDAYYEFAKGATFQGAPPAPGVLDLARETMVAFAVAMGKLPSVPPTAATSLMTMVNNFWMLPPLTFTNTAVVVNTTAIPMTGALLGVALGFLPATVAGIDTPKKVLVSAYTAVLAGVVINATTPAGPPGPVV
jgi:hypothetical protein